MPTRGEQRPLLLDTSAAVAFLVADHEDHALVYEALASRSLGLAGHAAFETFSVLTRLPPPVRRTPQAVGHLLEVNFPSTKFLSPEGAADLFARLAPLRIAGGAVYDALVGAAAKEHGLSLATRDRRAVETYRSVGVDVEVLG